MSSTITKQQFVATMTAENGTIDLDSPSLELLMAMKDAGAVDDSGVALGKLQEIAGADGRIHGAAEMGKLYGYVDSFDASPEGPNPARGFDPSPTPGLDGKPEFTGSAALYSGLMDEVSRNRSRAWLAKPGSSLAPPQPRLTVEGSAEVVAPEAQKKPIALNVPGINQFKYGADHGIDGATACFPTAVAQAEEYNRSKLGARAPRLEGADEAIRVAYAEDEDGRTAVDSGQSARAHQYIDKCLEKGLPAVVGVSYAHEDHNEKITDHFLTIDGRGYDEAGRAYYAYKDPGDGGRAGKLYLDKNDEQLFKEGSLESGYVRDLDYQVTQVRTYASVR
ncbi:MAG: hypothetical protein U1E65_26235 [Myxococcota bacterium]